MEEDDVIPAFIEAATQQLDSPDTPFVRATHQRLIDEEEIDAEEALKMIAFCLADEVETMSNEKRNFDLSRYQMLLDLLPAMPEG